MNQLYPKLLELTLFKDLVSNEITTCLTIGIVAGIILLIISVLSIIKLKKRRQ